MKITNISKKTLCIFIGMSMAISVISACNNGTDNSNESSEIEEYPFELMTVDGVEIPKAESLGLKSKKIEYMHFGGGREFLTGGAVYEKLKEVYDVEIVSVKTPFEESASKLSALISSNESPDIVDISSIFPTFPIQGLVDPVDGLINYDDVSLMNVLKPGYESFIYQDKHWVLVSGQFLISALFYNKQMFLDNDLETPRELYLKGEWTWDAFLNAAKELTIDEDRDGTPDRYGVLMANWQSSRFIFSTGVPYVNYDGEMFTNNLNNTEYNRAFDFLYNLVYTEKVASPNRDIGWVHNAFDVGKSAMIMTAAWMSTNARYFPTIKNEGNLEFVPYPKDPLADKYYTNAQTNGRFLAKGAKNIGEVKAFVYIDSLVQNRKLEIDTDSYMIQYNAAKQASPNMSPEYFQQLSELTKEYNTTLDLVFDSYEGIIDVDLVYRDMIGTDDGQTKSFEQAVNNLIPGINDILEIFNN